MRYKTCEEYNDAMSLIQEEIERSERTEVLEDQWEELLQERNAAVSAGRIAWVKPE